jgi:hypothetical protein
VKASATDRRLPLLWQDPTPESGIGGLLAKIRWSYTRRSVLEQCPRRYYYDYYGASARDAIADPNKTTLRFLKSLQTRYERAGTIAHLVVNTYFRRGQSGEVWEADRLCDWAQDMFRRDYTYSRTDPDGIARPTGRFPPVLLQEYYYRHPEAPALCAEVEERLVKGLRTFHTSVRFGEFRLAGISRGALIEHNLTLPGLRCRVDGKLDLAFTAGRSVTVVDWKTGDPSGSGDESLQLATYALWASCHFAAAAEAITVCKAFLNADVVVQFPVSESVLANARARILQDAERMAVLHDYGQRGKVEAFTPCAQASVCALCPFQEVCPEGRAVLYA